ncbi:MAG: tetratricopeptide repeat protein [Flavobacteriales bacterium]
MKKTLVSVILSINLCFLASQNTVKDSLLIVLKTNQNDTNRLNTLLNLTNECYYKGEYFEERKYAEEALKLAKKMNWKQGMANSYNSLGGAMEDLGFYAEALDNHFKALKIKEELKDTIGIATSYNNIGIVYLNLKKYDEAISYYKKSLKFYKYSNAKKSMANPMNNMGIAYFNLEDYAMSLTYYMQALEIRIDMGDKYAIASSYNNIGNLYYILEDYYEAMKYHLKSLKISEEIGDKYGITTSCNNIGNLYAITGNVKEGRKWIESALDLAYEIGSKSIIVNSYSTLYQLDSTAGDYRNSLLNFHKFIIYRDSLINEENTKQATQLQMQYEFDKKETLLMAEYEKQNTLNLAEKKRQQLYTALIAAIALAVTVIALIAYRALKITKKQKDVIEDQKHLIEEKHREITDSINYAERIQRSFLATKELLDRNLNDYFVLFKPKDVVSGDFYWASKLRNGNFAICCADSTGHGVPGAIMSILNISSLEKAIEKENEPHLILNKTREFIIKRLKKDGSPEGGKDGMDCSLLVLNQDKTRLTFASAHSLVIMIRAGEVIEYKGDKMPVGKHQKDQEPFILQTIQLQKGDVIYTLTDGFPDQFGGEKGKKYMIKNLKQLFLSIAHLPMSEQEQKLKQEFAAWKGESEQVDDVCVIGMKI